MHWGIWSEATELFLRVWLSVRAFGCLGVGLRNKARTSEPLIIWPGILQLLLTVRTTDSLWWFLCPKNFLNVPVTPSSGCETAFIQQVRSFHPLEVKPQNLQTVANIFFIIFTIWHQTVSLFFLECLNPSFHSRRRLWTQLGPHSLE